MEITSYLMGKKAGGGGSTINNQDKTLTSNGQYTADSGYTGLGTVTVNVPEPSGTISITQNGDNIDVKDYAKANVNVPEPTGNINITDTNQTNVKDYATAQVVDEDLVAGNIKKDVNILGVVGTYEGSGGDVSEYFDDTIDGSSISSSQLQTGFSYTILKLPKYKYIKNNSLFFAFRGYQGEEIDLTELENTSKVTDAMGFYGMFYQCPNLKTIKGLQNLNITNNTSLKNLGSMFSGCENLTSVSLFDTTNGNNMSSMFANCEKLTTTPQFNTSNVTNMTSMFSGCYEITTIPQFNTSNVTNMTSMFRNCFSLVSVPQLDTSNVTNMSYMFNIGNGGSYGYSSIPLEEIPELDASKVTNVNGMFNTSSPYLTSFTTFGGLKNLGQAYDTTKGANNSNYTLNLYYCSGTYQNPLAGLSHDSLMNVINKLYDIATAGCNAQQLVLGATNLAKLTAEEISTATNKGWSVS